MTQEFVTLPREVVELAIEALFCTDSEEGSTAYENELKAVKKLRAALKQPQDHIEQHLGMVPAGWRLVPVTPTPEMIRVMCAYDGTQYSNTFDSDDFKEDYRNMLAAAPQPQADQPAMTPIAQRKLDSLLAGGYTISGYSVYHERKHQHGFVTGAGLVGWWRPEGVEYPLPQGEQLKGCHKIDKPCRVGKWNFGVGNLCRRVIEEAQRQYNNPQPKRDPLTDEQIDAIADAMPGGLEGFMKGWGWRQFARAVIEAAHNIK